VLTRRVSLFSLACVSLSLFTGCTTQNICIESETGMGIPLLPAVLPGWDQSKNTPRYVVPAQKSPSGLEVAIGLPFLGFIMPSWENERVWSSHQKKLPGYWRQRMATETGFVRKKKKKKAKAVAAIGDAEVN
jgi:hypothetical protein